MIVFCIVFLFSIYFEKTNSHGFHGTDFRNIGVSSRCLLSSGENGICTSLYVCPEILSLPRKQRRRIKCGFLSTITPTVCCPPDKKDSGLKDSQNTEQNVDLSPTSSLLDQFKFECGISNPKKGGQSHRKRRYVVGGEETPIGKYPWMALVGKYENGALNWICDGVLIHPLWVISAAHCVLHKIRYGIRLGEHNISSTDDGAEHQDFNVSQIIFHPDFQLDVGYHDLVLLKLNQPVKIQRFIRPICLPFNGLEGNIVGKSATLAGWGAENFGGRLSNVLRHATVTFFNATVCDKSYATLDEYKTLWPKRITGKYLMCAGNVNGGIDSCQGDSGGPLAIKTKEGRYCVIGIVSKGFGCGLKDFPGIYISIEAYLSWIIKQIINS